MWSLASIGLMSLYLPTSFLLVCLEDASQIASTRARDTGYWGTSKSLRKQVTQQRSFAEWRQSLRLVPGAKLPRVERIGVLQRGERAIIGNDRRKWREGGR